MTTAHTAAGHTPWPDRPAVHGRPVPPLKRCVDLLVAWAALVLLAPVLAAVWVWIRLDSPGPAIFRQERLGQGARPITVYKFRTMRVDTNDAVHRAYVTQLLTAPDPVPGGEAGLFKLERDPRVTRAGVWLRRTSADELPQLVNVVRGEMSLVGPRPVLAWEAQLFEPRHWERFAVPPGITGLWQVSGRSRLTMRQALELDLEYVRRSGLLVDLAILARTLPSVLGRSAR